MTGPTAIPGYRFAAKIGAGASGVVYRAIQEQLGRQVAVKLLSPGLFGEAETRARFLRETKLQAQLSHPSLLALYDAGFHEGRPYLVTELVEGRSLRERIDRAGALSPAEAIRLGVEIAQGLEHAHKAGIVHRDLKPENVLLTLDGKAKIADFGLAKSIAAPQTVQTQTGVILGTPGYMAPEAIAGEATGPAADIYALGAILFEMLAGRAPFGPEEPGAMLRAQLDGKRPALGTLRDGLPPALEQLVESCLETDPARRPRDIAHRLGAIGPAPRTAVSKPLERAAAAATIKTQVPRARRWPLAAIPALALLAFLARPGAPPPPAPAPAAAAPPPKMPAIARCTVSRSAIRVWFDSPAPKGLKASIAPSGQSTPSFLSVDEGAPGLRQAGLNPDASYSVELELSSQRRSIQTRTLPAARGSAWSLLAPGDGDGLVVRALGSRVAAAWLRERETRGDQMLLRESFDGGETWGPLEHPFDHRDADGLSLELTPEGLLVGISDDSRASGGTYFRFKGQAWGPEYGHPASDVDAYVPLAQGSDGRMFALVQSDGPADEFRLVRFAAAKGFTSGDLANVPPLRGASVRRLVQTRGRLVALASGENEDTDFVLAWSEREDKADAAWTPFAPLSDGMRRVSRHVFDTAVSGARLAVCYASHGRTVILVSPGPSRPFGPPAEPATGPRLLRLQVGPGLAASADRFYTVFAEGLAANGEWLVYVLESVDGTSWTKVASTTIPADLGAAAFRAALSGDHLAVVADGGGLEGMAAATIALPRKAPR